MSLLDSTCQLKDLTGKNYVFRSLFENCTALITAPELPATTLADGCYGGMFSGCTSLTTAPALPATTLANWCYYDMSENCELLTTLPAELPATTLVNSCYARMFYNCKKLTKSPEIRAISFADTWCCGGMFWGCNMLTEVTVHFAGWGDSTTTNLWLQDVSSSGTFKCPAGLAETRGSSNIPENWTVEHL